MTTNLRHLFSAGLIALTTLPQLVSAQIAQGPDAGPLQDLIVNLLAFIDEVIIPGIIALAFLFFVWGMFKYFILGGADEEKKEQGKSLLIHATIGFVVIIIFFGVINLITTSTGLEGQELQGIPDIQFP
jgi:heme/copper-type cytochrome/quinol oxidase subunit 2